MPPAELENVWAWSRVLAWHASIQEVLFWQHLPAYQQMADFRNVNRGRNTKAVEPLDLMPDHYVPELWRVRRTSSGNGNKWTVAVVESFALLLRRRRASNALLNALHITDLRASGYKG